jgi:hypothetical protein
MYTLAEYTFPNGLRLCIPYLHSVILLYVQFLLPLNIQSGSGDHTDSFLIAVEGFQIFSMGK